MFYVLPTYTYEMYRNWLVVICVENETHRAFLHFAILSEISELKDLHAKMTTFSKQLNMLKNETVSVVDSEELIDDFQSLVGVIEKRKVRNYVLSLCTTYDTYVGITYRTYEYVRR